MTQKAIDIQKRDAFYFEALRICRERDFDPEALPNIAAGLRHRAFMDAIQPLQRMQARVVAFAMPTTIIRDGRLERLDDGLNDEQRAVIASLNGMIIEAAQQYGLHYCPLNEPPAGRSAGRGKE